MARLSTTHTIHGAKKTTITPVIKESKNVCWVSIDVANDDFQHCEITVFGDGLELPKITFLPTEKSPADPEPKATQGADSVVALTRDQLDEVPDDN